MVTIFDITSRSTDYTSNAFDAFKKDYSVELEVTGTFNIDVKLQVSIGENQWADLSGSSFTAQTSGPISWDVSVGRHSKVRMAITVNSGTMDTATARVSNGY